MIGVRPFILQICNGMSRISYDVMFTTGRDGSLEMQIFVTGIDGYIVTQNGQIEWIA